MQELNEDDLHKKLDSVEETDPEKRKAIKDALIAEYNAHQEALKAQKVHK